MIKYRCDVCNLPTLHGHAVFDICRVCWWEDDGRDSMSRKWHRRVCGPNRVSLIQARRNFARFGRSERRFLARKFGPRKLPIEQKGGAQ